MSYEKLTETLNDNQNVRVEHLQHDFASCLRDYGMGSDYIDIYSIAAAYVFYKAYSNENGLISSMRNNYLSRTFVEGMTSLDEYVLYTVRELSPDIWNRLEVLSHQYLSEDFALAILSFDLRTVAFRGGPITATPASIVKLAQAVLNVKPNEKVADLFCGLGTFITSTYAIEKNASYYGCDNDRFAKLITAMRAEILGIDADIVLKNVLDFANEGIEQKFDKIFAEYPLKSFLGELNKTTPFWNKFIMANLNRGRLISEWVYNAIICDMLAEDGKAVAIMLSGSMLNGMESAWRKFFVDAGLIEAVIALPPRMFNHYGVASSMVVFSHGNKSVKLVDATELYTKGRRQNEFSEANVVDIMGALNSSSDYSLEVSYEELQEHDFALNINRYMSRDIIFENGVPFESVIVNMKRGVPLNAGKLDELATTENTGIKYLQVSNLKDSIIEDKLVNLTSVAKNQEKYFLKDKDFVLSKVGFPCKTAVVSVKDGEHILPSSNMLAFELDEKKVDPYYLQAFFHSETGMALLKSISVGATVMTISVDKLKNMSIPLPSLEEQKVIAQRFQNVQTEIALLKLQLEKAYIKLNNAFDEGTEE